MNEFSASASKIKTFHAWCNLKSSYINEADVIDTIKGIKKFKVSFDLGNLVDAYVTDCLDGTDTYLKVRDKVGKDLHIEAKGEITDWVYNFKKDYPILYNYLLRHKANLAKRNQEETGKRYEWYALQRCAATYEEEFSKDKIVWQEMTKKPGFSFDSKGYYCSDTARIMTGEDLLFLLGLFNSTFFTKIFSRFYAGGGLGSKGIRFKSEFMKKFPIPPKDKSNIETYEKIVSKVKNILKNNDDIQNIKEIETLIHTYYQLTQEESSYIQSLD